MNLLSKFLPRVEFDSYEDFKKNYRVEVPENFNFAYDVVDAWAADEPDRRALCLDRQHAAQLFILALRYGGINAHRA